MKIMGNKKVPQRGDKVWRELQLEHINQGLGANGKIIWIDWSSSPPEYVAFFSRPTEETGQSSRQSYTRDEMDWSDRFGGTWVIGDLPAF